MAYNFDGAENGLSKKPSDEVREIIVPIANDLMMISERQSVFGVTGTHRISSNITSQGNMDIPESVSPNRQTIFKPGSNQVERQNS